jgi:hypothetical protein
MYWYGVFRLPSNNTLRQPSESETNQDAALGHGGTEAPANRVAEQLRSGQTAIAAQRPCRSLRLKSSICAGSQPAFLPQAIPEGTSRRERLPAFEINRAACKVNLQDCLLICHNETIGAQNT